MRCVDLDVTPPTRRPPGFGPHSGTVVQPTDAPGYFAVSPPSATAKIASTAAARAERAARARAALTRALVPPSAPARIAVVATIASSVIATSQCATVAHGALPIFTVTPPRIAAANTAPTAPSAERSTPPRPPTPGSSRDGGYATNAIEQHGERRESTRDSGG